MRSLVWFRADLRVADHRALHHACRQADDGVVGVFLLAPAQWQEHDWAGCKVDFLLRNLRALSERLGELNIPLVVATAKRFSDAPAELLKIAKRTRGTSLHFNKEYEINEARRDDQVRSAFEKAGMRVWSYDDQIILAPGDVRTGEGRFFTVFTPFKRAWMKRVEELETDRVLATPGKQPKIDVEASETPENVLGFSGEASEKLWPAGEAAAKKRLAAFTTKKIGSYKDDRDAPAREGTSRLSAYLALGVLSPRQCLKAAVEANNGKMDGGKEGPAQWISELVWREFYKHVVVGFPRVVMGKAFKPATDGIRWRYDEKDFGAWCEGRTGVPIVDAAMRQLLTEGWMHNRLRMVTAMYLTKDLFIDWRWGERHFMRHLVDGDFASNNGGWQWSASTGTDAAPYFRMFNPLNQSRQHDPEGDFIRTYVPELKDVDAKAIHDPPPLVRAGCGYPMPIMEQGAGKERVMKEFGRVKGTAEKLES